MNTLNVQKKLTAAGYPVKPDGDFGPKMLTALLNYTVGRDLGATSILLGRALAAELPKYQITTALRLSHFLAQCAHETNGFRSFVEKGNGDGPDADPWDDYLERYDFRADLGNSKGGDGEKYRGRGIFQLTGKFNYTKFAKRLGIDLVNQPQRAAEPEISVVTACLYWADRNMNALADADDVRAVTKKINGGYNGLADRAQYLARLKALLV